MAIYHCTVKTHSRRNESTNHAVRSAAYRAGAKLIDANSGNIYNYTRKHEVRFSEIRLPTKAPARFKNRSELWSEVEKSEKRVDAQLFREIEVALPRELSKIQMIELLRVYLDEYAVKYGMIADYSIHDDENGNPHAHIMLTMRELEGDGFGKKNRDWNDKKILDGWRKGWEKCANKALKEAGFDIRIDSRSYAEQGLDIEPTKHEGRTNISKSNSQKVDSRKNQNRDIGERNYIRSAIKTKKIELAAIEAQIAEVKTPEQSTLKIVRQKMLTSLKPVSVALEKTNNEPIPNIVKLSSETVATIKLANINKRILQSVKPVGVYQSNSTAMVVYQTPKLELSESGINRAYMFNIPTHPMDAQGCYALRAILGVKEANTEFNQRQSALKLVGMNYAWRDFYDEVKDGCKLKHGAMHSWWRSYARMCFHEHGPELQELVQAVPDKYKDTVNSVIADELKKAHPLPDQPKSAIWIVDKQKPEPVKPEPVAPIIEPARNPPPNIPPPQQKHVEEAVTVKPFNPYPDPYRIPTPKPPNPWGSGSGFNPW